METGCWGGEGGGEIVGERGGGNMSEGGSGGGLMKTRRQTEWTGKNGKVWEVVAGTGRRGRGGGKVGTKRQEKGVARTERLGGGGEAGTEKEGEGVGW